MSQIYTLNKHYFDTIDTHEKAYFLGILWADGTNITKKGDVSLTQMENNHEVLYALQKEIGSNCPIKIRQYPNMKSPRYEMYIYNRYVSDKLAGLGMIANKTHHTYFPDIDTCYYNSFILGYFDGDGSISNFPGNYNNHSIGFTGNDTLIYKIKSVVKENFNINGYINTRHIESPNIISLTYTGNRNGQTIMAWLYKDCSIFNPRKKAKYEFMCQCVEGTDFRRENKRLKRDAARVKSEDIKKEQSEKQNTTELNVVHDLHNGYSIRQIRLKYGRNSAYIRNIITKYEIPYGKRKRMFAKQPIDF